MEISSRTRSSRSDEYSHVNFCAASAYFSSEIIKLWYGPLFNFASQTRARHEIIRISSPARWRGRVPSFTEWQSRNCSVFPLLWVIESILCTQSCSIITFVIIVVSWTSKLAETCGFYRESLARTSRVNANFIISLWIRNCPRASPTVHALLLNSHSICTYTHRLPQSPSVFALDPIGVPGVDRSDVEKRIPRDT